MSKNESKLSPLFKLRNYISEQWHGDKKYFLGRVLTIVDASVSDPEQRKGIKDLVNDAYYGAGDFRDIEFREILLDFCKKYCPDIYPDEADEAAFRGAVVSSDSVPVERFSE